MTDVGVKWLEVAVHIVGLHNTVYLVQTLSSYLAHLTTTCYLYLVSERTETSSTDCQFLSKNTSQIWTYLSDDRQDFELMNVAIQVISLTRILIQQVSIGGIEMSAVYSCRQVWTGGTLN